MDSQTIDAVAAAIRTVTDAGYALVKLPETTVDQDGSKTWLLPEIDKWASVFRRPSDGRIAINSVPNPISEPAHALALGAALVAAAQDAETTKHPAPQTR